MYLALDDYLEKQKTTIMNQLSSALETVEIPERLKASMAYSLKAGGKRIRPVLMLASNQAYEANQAKVIKSALALEMVHTYSLIHDDLPAMDDDNLRRGKPTNHKQFDEATAILAGDALLTYSFELISSDESLTNQEKVFLVRELAMASGPSGMVAGQMLDTEAEENAVSLEELEKIHTLKTGALLTFAIISGAYLGQASESQLAYLRTFSYYLGLIFQVQDDLLDEIGDEEKLGKPVGSDAENDKSTYPKLLGLAGAKLKKMEYVELAKQALKEASASDSYLMELTEYISARDH